MLNAKFFKASSQVPLVTLHESMFVKVIFQGSCRFWAFLANYNLHKYHKFFHPRSLILAEKEEIFLLNESSLFCCAFVVFCCVLLFFLVLKKRKKWLRNLNYYTTQISAEIDVFCTKLAKKRYFQPITYAIEHRH